MKNILLTIAYDGSGFHGWQRQPGARTVQGALEEALQAVIGQAVSLEGASRTDAGVHALGQRATLRGDFAIPTERIPIAANNLLSDVCILAAEEKPEGFHARFDAAAKTYEYRFAIIPPAPAAGRLNANAAPDATSASSPAQATCQPNNTAAPDAPPPAAATPLFLRNYACLLANRPNTGIMAEAAKHIEGTHDFACFQAAGGAPRATTVRTVFGIGIAENQAKDAAGCPYEEIVVSVTGDGFLYNMVRIIAGTLADAGSGKLAPQELKAIIASGDRARAGPTAPPQGLYLKEVFYGEGQKGRRSQGDRGGL